MAQPKVATSWAALNSGLQGGGGKSSPEHQTAGWGEGSPEHRTAGGARTSLNTGLRGGERGLP